MNSELESGLSGVKTPLFRPPNETPQSLVGNSGQRRSSRLLPQDIIRIDPRGPASRFEMLRHRRGEFLGAAFPAQVFEHQG
jgi:hypothetical protein